MSEHDHDDWRPMGTAVAGSLLAGAMAGLRLPQFLPMGLSAALVVLGCIAWMRGRRWSRGWGALLLGLGLCGLHGAYSLALRLPLAMERSDVEVGGVVVGLPVHEPQRTQFMFRVDDDANIAEPLRGRLLRLSWHDPRRGVDRRREQVLPGSRWTFTTRLRAPRGLRNPGWFDSEKHALAGRVAAVGYVRTRDHVQRTGEGRGIDGWRHAVAARIDVVVAGDGARFVRALAIGDTRALADGDWEALRATGLTHLVAISGFHVGMVGGFFALLASGLWWWLPGLGRWLPRPQVAAIVALPAASAYAAVAGWELPTVRTVLMIAVVVVARLARQRLRVFDAVALAAIVVVLVDPLSVLSAGFWLSFAGVAWLAWCLPDAHHHSMLRGLLASQWVATLGLLPLTVVLFGQASLAGPLANLVAIPWWSLVVVPLALLGTGLEALSTGAGDGVWRLAAWAFELSWPLFTWLASSPLALWWLPESPWFALPLALLGAFWLLLPRGVPGKTLALLLWLPLLWPDRRLPDAGEIELVVLDVGQGLSVLVRTAGQSILYDAGPAVPDGYDAGERVVVPALHALGVRKLDAIIISHADTDHVGGFAAVQRRFPAPVVFAPRHEPVPGASPCLMGGAMAGRRGGVPVPASGPAFPAVAQSRQLRAAGRGCAWQCVAARGRGRSRRTAVGASRSRSPACRRGAGRAPWQPQLLRSTFRGGDLARACCGLGRSRQSLRPPATGGRRALAGSRGAGPWHASSRCCADPAGQRRDHGRRPAGAPAQALGCGAAYANAAGYGGWAILSP